MKVHIVLDDSTRQNPEAKETVLRRLVDEVELAEVNLARFQRHGILSGELPDQNLSRAEKIDGVKSVSVDTVRKAL